MEKSSQTLEQHEELLLRIERLRVVAKWKRGFLREMQLRRLIERDLRPLVELLAEHFSFEEEGDYLEEVTRRRPAWTASLERLQEQHADLRAAFADLLGRVRGDEMDPFKRDLLAMLDRLARHEEAETELLQRAFTDELGGPD